MRSQKTASERQARRLTAAQEAEALGWLADRPTAHGFPTDRGTSRCLGALIGRRFGVAFHPRYLWSWLRAPRNISRRMSSPGGSRHLPRVVCCRPPFLVLVVESRAP